MTKWQGFAAEQLVNRSIKVSHDEVKVIRDQLAESTNKQVQIHKEKVELEQNNTQRI